MNKNTYQKFIDFLDKISTLRWYQHFEDNKATVWFELGRWLKSNGNIYLTIENQPVDKNKWIPTVILKPDGTYEIK